MISEYPSTSLAEAYEVQLYIFVNNLLTVMALLVKKGFTSKEMQISIKAEEPDYGHLLDSMVITKEKTILNLTM